MQTPRLPGIELGAELGRGAHSIVYRGERNGVPCAVKLPRTRARWTRWIYREAVALARVRHSGLPAVLEVGEAEELPFLVMELVEGETLADRLARKALSIPETVDAGIQLANVLAAVHDVGLVHRDVKPRNIVIEGNGRVRLVDFGFATPMERTGDGETAGTAAYAAPEQLVPPGRVDARSDLYCLGRVLLECVLGEEFRSFEAAGEGLVADLVRRGVRSDLAEVIRHLVAREPHDRYPDAHALAHDLDAIRVGGRVLGPMHGTGLGAPRTTVARSRELAEAVDAIGVARSGGRLILLQGTRGSGKTRLLTALEHAVRPLARTISMRCVQGDPPLATLRRLLESCTSRTSAEWSALGPGQLEELVGNLAPIAQVISPRLGLGANERTDAFEATDALAEGAAEIVLRLSQHYGRLVVIVDDIQWMDRVSAEALLRAAHRVGEAALALVLSSRSEAAQRPLLELFLSVHAIEVPTSDITLAPLTEEAVSQLVSSHLGTRTIDPLVVARIHALADGTPLGVLEILGVFLDAGALRPQGRAWTFDPSRLGTVDLPSGALTLLGRRLREIPAATRRVLEAAAIWGASFHEAEVAAALDVTVETIAYASVNAARAGVIEATDDDGGYRFVHDSLREALLDELPEADRRRLHQRAAELLAARPGASFEELCASARHFAMGEPSQSAPLVHRIASSAAAEAFKRGDNEATLELERQAAAAAKQAGLPPSVDLLRLAGEAQLRLGDIAESVRSFRDGIALARDSVERASLHGRVAWAYSTVGDPDKAWEALGRAFAELGERMPVEDVASALTTTRELARPRVGRLLTRRPVVKPRPEREVDVLCWLHYQNVRLAFEYGKVGRAIQSSLISHTLSSQTRSLSTRARARAIYAFVLTALGFREAGLKEVEEAVAISKRLDDLTTATFCGQMRAVTLGWGGRLEEMLLEYRDIIDRYGAWSEVTEYMLHVGSGALVLFVMGRNDVAWSWIEKGLGRARRSHANHTTAVILVQRARALLATLGRGPEPGSWLAAQMEKISIDEPGDGYHRILTWGARATYYYEKGELGAAFERLVADFDAEKLNPRTIHLAGVEFYVAVAHARIQQCFAAAPSDRKAAVVKLARVARSLRLAARIPALDAHALFVEACLAWFKGDVKGSTKVFAEAETLATTENLTWVIAAIARARAHILRSEGKLEAARDQARVAETLSREHGAIARARAIALEFGLATAAPTTQRSSVSRRSSRTNRQLSVLLHVVRGTRRDQKADQVATSILDELLTTLSAERGAIWFQPEIPSAGTAVTRHRNSTTSVSITPQSPLGALLREVHRRGAGWPGGPSSTESGVVLSAYDPSRMLVVPLHLYEQPVGALAMERGASDPAFAPEDQQLLELLAHQVPIALEIARLLAEREQLHASLQQSQKLEAIGQLAGGLAHDFNNMLAAMRVALGIALERAGEDEEMRAELDIIAQATTRASQLTSQLLTFSRSEPLPLQVHDVNQLIVALEPMLRRVAPGSVDVKLALSPIVDAVSIDSSSFDQALMNLLINARDAMPNGGTFTIFTRNVVLDESAALRANVSPGAYVEVEVVDTGEGMSPEVQNRIFEPFFTTKPVGRGTGLGLATVYGFVRNCGGGIVVSSQLGVGTRFTLYLKRADRLRARRRRTATSSSSMPATGIPDTILVVDDDDLVRRSIAKILERNGYRVLAASGSTEALDVARSQQGKRIGLVIMDVLLPGVTGPELGRRLNDLLPAKVLFVSGFSAESAPIEDAKVTPEMLLQKPFTQAALLARVRELMPS
ncbi:MAG: protein kinase [Labilithrix sp.]